jgi:AcrR family transcriptional regulator
LRRDSQPATWNGTVQSRDQQFDLKRNALLKQAARAFSSHGYHATSLDDVAKTLGVTKPALYYYVKNKQEILFECHMMSQDLGDRALDHALKTATNNRDIVLLMGRTYIELLTSEIGACAVLAEINALNPVNRKIIAERRDKFERRFRKLLVDGMADGSIRAVDPKLTVFFFMGAVNWMTRWFTPDGSSSGEEIAQRFVDLLDHAISARA